MNTNEYEWSDVTVLLGGRQFAGITGVSYTASQEKSVIYGQGNEPHAIQKGNKSYEGNVKILQSVLEILQDVAGGSVLDLEFDIVVRYGNPSKGQISKTDILKACQFTEEAKELNSGDLNMECELPFIFLRKERG